MVTKEEFITLVKEGLAVVQADQSIDYLLGKMYDVKLDLEKAKRQLKVIDNLSVDVKVKCVCCGEYYDIWCDLSEFDPENSYCGRSERCCP